MHAPQRSAPHLRVTSVPDGEAPLWVRERWVGLSLPLAQRATRPMTWLTSGVLTGPRSVVAQIVALLTGKLARERGFRVEVRAAIDVLAASSPDAAAWWRANLPVERRWFVFQEGAGQVVPSGERR